MRPFVHCPECNHGFRLPSSTVAGDDVICPNCGAQVVRPATEFDGSADGDDQGPAHRARSLPRKSASRLLIGFVLGCGTLVLLCGGGIAALAWWFLAPTAFPEQTEDYSQARQHFRTHLIRQGPAPQDWKRERPPRGVNEVTYKSGKLALKAWVNEAPPIVPGENARKPAVVFLHGGFSFEERDWEQAQPFREAGFVVLVPMLRAENGLPGSYSLFYDEVDDVLAAAEFLAHLPYVDDKRLYVAGHEVGGTLALLAAMTSKRFRAAASFSGSPDQVVWARGMEQSIPKEQLIPFDPDDRQEFMMRSPLAFPRSFKCPARLYYGKQEPFLSIVCPKTAERAQRANLDVEAVQVPGTLETAVLPAMRLSIAFFQQH